MWSGSSHSQASSSFSTHGHHAGLDGYADRISDFEVEVVDGVGHWIVEQRPELVLDRLRSFFKAET
jgi:pimeloyl-ACP methyl ester carboxylesterase